MAIHGNSPTGKSYIGVLTPKCGSRSVLGLTRNLFGSHQSIHMHSRVTDSNDPNPVILVPPHDNIELANDDTTFVFAFIRHPFTCYKSWWVHLGVTSERKTIFGRCYDEDFNKFIANIANKQPGALSTLYRAYTYRTNFIGLLERLVWDLWAIADLLDIELDVTGFHPHIFKKQNPGGTLPQHKDSTLSRQSRKLICDMDTYALELWEKVADRSYAK